MKDSKKRNGSEKVKIRETELATFSGVESILLRVLQKVCSFRIKKEKGIFESTRRKTTKNRIRINSNLFIR